MQTRSQIFLFLAALPSEQPRLSGRLSGRFGPTHLVVTFLALLIGIQFALTTLITTALLLPLWGMSFALLFIPQQQRLLNIAPKHANVLLALNNSALYLGIAGGAGIGGLLLRWLPLTQLARAGIIRILIAFLLVGV